MTIFKRKLPDNLKKIYGGCETVMDAVRVQIHRNRIAEANASPGQDEINSQLETCSSKREQFSTVDPLTPKVETRKDPAPQIRLPYADDSGQDELKTNQDSHQDTEWDLFEPK